MRGPYCLIESRYSEVRIATALESLPADTQRATGAPVSNMFRTSSVTATSASSLTRAGNSVSWLLCPSPNGEGVGT